MLPLKRTFYDPSLCLQRMIYRIFSKAYYVCPSYTMYLEFLCLVVLEIREMLMLKFLFLTILNFLKQ